MNGSPPDSATSVQVALEHRPRVEEFQRRHRIVLLTLLFTDIVGSTRLKQSLGDQEGVALIRKHHALVRETLKSFPEAEEISTAGDSFFIVFAKPSDAVKFSLMLQARLRANLSDAGALVRDRVGIHIGEVFVEEQPGAPRGRDLLGVEVDRCARVMSLAEAGQVLVSRSCLDTAREALRGELIPGLGELSWVRHGIYALKGIEEPMEICEVGETGLAPLRPPPDTEKAYRKLAPIFTGQAGFEATRELPQASPEDQRSLALLRDRVKQFWVDEILEKSFAGMVRLELGKQTMPGAVEHPWEMVLELPDHTSQMLPANKPIEDVFEQVGRSLLVLGEPGSGKTITLLELARALILRHQGDPGQPVPVVFNLSTWTSQKSGFLAWLIEELKAKYYVPWRLGRRLLTGNRLLPLLDGLDEVRAEERAGCVEAINDYLQEYGVPGLAVCSRVAEYTALPMRLRLNGAVCLQPLSQEQVDSHLARAGPRLEALKLALGGDPVLGELATSPLMLSIMSVAYQDATVDLLKAEGMNTTEARRSHLLTAYIDRMFERRGKGSPRYTKQQTQDGLAWLAQKMREHGQTVFLIEQMQPSWLSSAEQLAVYTQVSRLMVGLFLGTVAVLAWNLAAFLPGKWDAVTYPAILGCVFGFCWQLLDKFAWRLAGGVAWGIVLAFAFGQSRVLVEESGLVLPILGVLLGQLAAHLDRLSLNRPFPQTPESQTPPHTRGTHSLVVDSVCGFGVGLGVCLLASRGPALVKTWELFWGSIWGLAMGLIWGLLFRMRGGNKPVAEDIRMVETLRWSWKDGLGNGLLWSLGGLGVAAVCMLLDDLLEVVITGEVPSWTIWGRWRDWLLIGAIFCLSGLTLGIVFGGLLSDLIKARTRPNQGIRLSLRNAAWGLVTIGMGSLLIAVYWLWLGRMTYDLRSVVQATQTIALASVFAPAGALWYGGADVMRHWTLRSVLLASHTTPTGFVRFLDFAVHLAFLRKVGGGYIFIHRTLLEQFSELRPVQEPTPNKRFGCTVAKTEIAAFAVSLALGLGIAGALGYGRQAVLPRWLAKEIPARDPRADPRLVDLSRYYNTSLTNYWLRRPGEGLAALPRGIQEFGGVAFDVRGVIQLRQLRSEALFDARYPVEVLGIKLGLKCRRLHFLHDTIPWRWTVLGLPGALTSTFVVHYANGQRREILMVYGDSAGNPLYDGVGLDRADTSVVAWLETNAARPWYGTRLHRTTWQNPLANVPIKSIDYKSKMTRAAPFLVAITAE